MRINTSTACAFYVLLLITVLDVKYALNLKENIKCVLQVYQGSTLTFFLLARRASAHNFYLPEGIVTCPQIKVNIDVEKSLKIQWQILNWIPFIDRIHREVGSNSLAYIPKYSESLYHVYFFLKRPSIMMPFQKHRHR